jgi:hypothetical protein
VLLHAGTESLGHSEHRDIGVPRPDATGEKNVPVHRAENENKKNKRKIKNKNKNHEENVPRTGLRRPSRRTKRKFKKKK